MTLKLEYRSGMERNVRFLNDDRKQGLEKAIHLLAWKGGGGRPLKNLAASGCLSHERMLMLTVSFSHPDTNFHTFGRGQRDF